MILLWGIKMIYRKMDIIYSEDEGGYYAQDFSKPTCPTSEVYEDLKDLKIAIDRGTIKLRCLTGNQRIGQDAV